MRPAIFTRRGAHLGRVSKESFLSLSMMTGAFANVNNTGFDGTLRRLQAVFESRRARPWWAETLPVKVMRILGGGDQPGAAIGNDQFFPGRNR